jgi:predicted neuraminidase/peroxiredoxin
MPFAVGNEVGPLPLHSLKGPVLTMTNYAERKATVVVFLSARCEPTASSIDTINALYEAFRFKGVLYVGLCANDAESNDELRAFLQAHGVRFPVYRDPGATLAAQFGAAFTPQAFLLDNRSALVYTGGYDGPGAAAETERAIGALVAGEPLLGPSSVATGTPIDVPGAPRPVPNRYGAPAIRSQLVFERIEGAPAHHCSTITEAANGDLLCTWYGGSYESADDQAQFIARRTAGGHDWSTPVRLIDTGPAQPPGNALIFTYPNGRVGLMWGRMEVSRPLRRGGGWRECRLFYRHSDDHGHTWSNDREIDGSFGWLPRNPPITFESGELWVPLSGRVDGRSGGFYLKTRDNGDTWEPSGITAGGSQPSIFKRDDGSLVTLLRSEPRILQSESSDHGATWSRPQPSALKCPGAGICALKLRSGRVIVVHNDTETSPRTPLSVAHSIDDGTTWMEPLKLEANQGPYSYPCAIQTRDDRIHVTYTFRRYAINHVIFNEDWLIHMDRPN